MSGALPVAAQPNSPSSPGWETSNDLATPGSNPAEPLEMALDGLVTDHPISDKKSTNNLKTVASLPNEYPHSDDADSAESDGLETRLEDLQLLTNAPEIADCEVMSPDSPIDLNGCEETDEGGSTIIQKLQTSSLAFASSSHYSQATDSLDITNPQTHARGVFLNLVTAVCEIYQSGLYLTMISLDKIEFAELGAGTVFKVSKAKLLLPGYSSRNHQHKELRLNRIVVKRNDSLGELTHRQIRGFVRELRVLHHLAMNPFIVDLRGVGWFEERRNSDQDDDHRWYKPALILEEAFNTLDYLIGASADPSYSDLLQIFGHITAGLLALHRCGIAHGDIKPQNILLFKRAVVHEGQQGQAYFAKISDFESAVFESDSKHGPLRYPPGTLGYRAPEADQSKLDVRFADLLLADAWSLGMVFVVTLSRRESIDFQGFSPAEWVRNRVRDMRRHLESSTSQSRHAEVVSAILQNTLRLKPTERDLTRVERRLNEFGLPRHPIASPGVISSRDEDHLWVGHETLKAMGYPFRDKLVSELAVTAKTSTRGRQAKALWDTRPP
jgi:serine/threonine protein kinase